MNYLDITTAKALEDVSDLYIKYERHPLYDEEAFEVSSIRDFVVNMIEVILFTNKGDVLGQPELGASLEELVWSSNMDANRIEREIAEQMYKFIPALKSNDYTINVEFVEGDFRDICHVVINLFGTTIAARFI